MTFAELREKYEEMLALRTSSNDAAHARPRLRALASRFPGALREIDNLPLSEIARRVHDLASAERDPRQSARWMHAMGRFHALARGALFVKRVLAERDVRASDEWPDEARAWSRDLDRIAHPPRGRLMDLVYEKLALELDVTPRDAKALIFAPRERATS